MLYLLNPKNMPFVGKGRPKLKKIMSLTRRDHFPRLWPASCLGSFTFRKQEQDLMQEIATAPPGIYIDESDSDDDCTSTNSQTPSVGSNDCSLIDTISDGKSLPSQSFAGYMMILKGYTPQANIYSSSKSGNNPVSEDAAPFFSGLQTHQWFDAE